MEHLLLLLVSDAALHLELVSGGYPAFIMSSSSVVGIDTLGNRGSGHKLGCVGPHAVVAHCLRIVPGDIASALVGGPAVAPNHVERSSNDMPCVVVVGIEVGDNTIRKFNQSEAQEGALRVSRPVHIGCAGLLTAGAAWVIGANASSGITGTDLGGDTFDRLWAEHSQRHAGVCAVGPVNGEKQVIAEVAQAVVRRFILCPGVELLIPHSI